MGGYEEKAGNESKAVVPKKNWLKLMLFVLVLVSFNKFYRHFTKYDYILKIIAEFCSKSYFDVVPICIADAELSLYFSVHALNVTNVSRI